MFLHNFYQYVQIYMTRYDVVVAVTAELQRGRPNARPGSGRLMRLFEAKLLSVGGSGSRTHPWAAETTLTVRVVHFLLLRCLHRRLNVLARPLSLTRSSHRFRFKCWYWFDWRRSERCRRSTNSPAVNSHTPVDTLTATTRPAHTHTQSITQSNTQLITQSNTQSARGQTDTNTPALTVVTVVTLRVWQAVHLQRRSPDLYILPC